MGIEKIYCEACKTEVDHVLVNGYDFGDRLLEDVMFIVQVKDGKYACENVDKLSRLYFDDLNKEKWLKECLEYCKEHDIATCPNCKDDISMPLLKCKCNHVLRDHVQEEPYNCNKCSCKSFVYHKRTTPTIIKVGKILKPADVMKELMQKGKRENTK